MSRTACTRVTSVCRFILFAALIASSGCGGSISKGADLGLVVSPGVVSFGAVPIDGFASQVVTFTHNGTSGTIQLGDASIVSESSDFDVEGPDEKTLKPGESTTVMVFYTPTDTVYDQGTLVIDHNLPNQDTLNIPIQTIQQAPNFQTIPSKMDFGNVSAGSSVERKLTVRNIGTAPVTVEDLGLDLQFGAPFEIVSEASKKPPFFMAIDGEAEVTLRFSPPIEGADTVYNANLRFITDHPQTNNRVVFVTGTGKHAMLFIKPGVVDFGIVSIGASEVATVQLQNVGAESIDFSSVELIDTDPSVSMLGVPVAPFKLQPLESLSVTLRFAPDAVVQPEEGILGQIHFSSSDYLWPERDLTIYGRSAKPSIQVTPSDVLDLGIVGIGFQHQRRLEITNVGFVPLTVESVALSDDTPADFVLSGVPSLPVLLAPAGTAQVEVSYINPGIEDGDIWGSLEIASDDPVSPLVKVDVHARHTILGACEPRLSPAIINFGVVGPGAEVSRILHLFNDGSLPCTYTAAQFYDCASSEGLCQPDEDTSAVFTLGPNAPSIGATVYSGDNLAIPIVYKPNQSQGTDSGLTSLSLVDGAMGLGEAFHYHPVAGGVPPTLVGTVGTAGIVVDPPSLDFGLTRVGCASQALTVNVNRLGAMPIQWSALDLAECGDLFEWVDPLMLPVPVYEPVEAAVALNIRFVPSNAGTTSCLAHLIPDATEAGAASVSLSGQGTTETLWTDTFTQAPENLVDILFVVDNSGSMSDEQQSLAQGFEGFIEQSAVWNVKYQIGLVTTDVKYDGGTLVGPPRFVTNNNNSPFLVNAIVGTDGSGDERGLLAAWLALQKDMVEDNELACNSVSQCPVLSPQSTCVDGGCGGPNRGFLRPNAKLAIIWVSDEEDHSPGELSEYLSFFKSLKAPGQVRGYAIVGDPSSETNVTGGCGGWTPNTGPFTGPAQGGEPAPRYANMAKLLGGSWYSICDFGNEAGSNPTLLEQIGADAFKPTQVFPLSQEPVQGTVTVLVDGQPCTSGWTYDDAQEALVFDPTGGCFPGPNANVEITYELICETL